MSTHEKDLMCSVKPQSFRFKELSDSKSDDKLWQDLNIEFEKQHHDDLENRKHAKNNADMHKAVDRFKLKKTQTKNDEDQPDNECSDCMKVPDK